MTIDEEFEKEIAEIIGGLKCPKDFKCYRSGFKALCKARQIGGAASFLECLEEDPRECIFSKFVSTGFYLCSCPLRKYIADKKQSET
jgi:hypothetical protein